MNWHQNTHLKIIPVLLWNQLFDPKHTLDNNFYLVLESVVWFKTRTWKWVLFCFAVRDFTPNIHLTMILVCFSNQLFNPNTHLTMNLVWFAISDLTAKRALENDSCFVLESVIWPQTHTWRWFLLNSVISDLILKHTTDNDFYTVLQSLIRFNSFR